MPTTANSAVTRAAAADCIGPCDASLCVRLAMKMQHIALTSRAQHEMSYNVAGHCR